MDAKLDRDQDLVPTRGAVDDGQSGMFWFFIFPGFLKKTSTAVNDTVASPFSRKKNTCRPPAVCR